MADELTQATRLRLNQHGIRHTMLTTNGAATLLLDFLDGDLVRRDIRDARIHAHYDKRQRAYLALYQLLALVSGHSLLDLVDLYEEVLNESILNVGRYSFNGPWLEQLETTFRQTQGCSRRAQQQLEAEEGQFPLLSANFALEEAYLAARRQEIDADLANVTHRLTVAIPAERNAVRDLKEHSIDSNHH